MSDFDEQEYSELIEQLRANGFEGTDEELLEMWQESEEECADDFEIEEVQA